jgi:hypothetical protein
LTAVLQLQGLKWDVPTKCLRDSRTKGVNKAKIQEARIAAPKTTSPERDQSVSKPEIAIFLEVGSRGRTNKPETNRDPITESGTAPTYLSQPRPGVEVVYNAKDGVDGP